MSKLFNDADGKLKFVKQRCRCCHRMVADEHKSFGGLYKHVRRHKCPHGVDCLAGQPNSGNNWPMDGIGRGCPQCHAERLAEQAEMNAIAEKKYGRNGRTLTMADELEYWKTKPNPAGQPPPRLGGGSVAPGCSHPNSESDA